MKIIYEEKYKIDSVIVSNYVGVINFINDPMSKVKERIEEYIKHGNSSNSDYSIYDSVNKMNEEINKLINTYPKEKSKIMINVIKQIMNNNNGIISTRFIEPLKISRQYLSDLEKAKEIERVLRGIYISKNVFEDSFYSFQAKYKKSVFSHMNALYFHDMTEEFPYSYTVTVSNSYHTDNVNEKCNVFYVSDKFLDLGLCEVVTPNGNKVRAYDIERCICDIIRSKNRMDMEQVYKTIKLYMNSDKKNMVKLTEYSEIMGIKKQVMEMVGMFNG